MPDLRDTVATPDGIDFAYQVAAEKLSSQLDVIDKLDAKLGVLIGALVTLASLYTATAKSAIAALILLIPAATSAVGYASRGWANPPNPIRLSEYANLGKQRMQEEALAAILAAYPANDIELEKKARLFNVSLILAIVAVVGLIILTALLPKTA
jgi:hypothetical protein